MHSWEVVCVSCDEESDGPEDCRRISEIGYLVAENLRTKDAATAHVFIENDNSHWHVETENGDTPLEPVEDGDQRYVRVLDEDSEDDPLLSLPDCGQYERDSKMSDL